ncbi:hypothetical protein ACWEQ8_17550 [Streptomyces noursei]
MTNPMDTTRLLPWTDLDGKPCYLLGGTGTGYVSRLADRVEAEQMASAADLIEDAAGILAARSWTPGEIHLLAVELNTQLTKVHRVSESRGARLVQWESDLDEDGEAEADDGSAPSPTDDGLDGLRPAHNSPDRPGPEQGQSCPVRADRLGSGPRSVPRGASRTLP